MTLEREKASAEAQAGSGGLAAAGGLLLPLLVVVVAAAGGLWLGPEQAPRVAGAGAMSRIVRALCCCDCRDEVALQGTRVILGRLLAEGGFSYVYKCTSGRGQALALKRVRCFSPEQNQQAEWELQVHRELSRAAHPNILPLLDWAVNPDGAGQCWSLLIPLARRGSLRGEIDLRVLGCGGRWPLRELLHMFAGVCRGAQALHAHTPEAWAHRDIKPENVLLSGEGVPMLMDFGSVAPANVHVRSRREALLVQERAAEHCTMPFRAPELWEVPSDAAIDARTDVWSLGCLLFALCYGFSPFECEFAHDSGSRGGVRVVECSYLRVIGRLPEPPTHQQAYPQHPGVVERLIGWMLQQDPTKRPTVDLLLAELDTLAASPSALDGAPGPGFADFASFPPPAPAAETDAGVHYGSL